MLVGAGIAVIFQTFFVVKCKPVFRSPKKGEEEEDASRGGEASTAGTPIAAKASPSSPPSCPARMAPLPETGFAGSFVQGAPFPLSNG